MKRYLTTVMVAVAITVTASPVAAATVLHWKLGRTTGTNNAASFTTISQNVSITATARQFSVLPDTLTQLSQTSAIGLIQQTVPGIGIKGGASDPQIDTNTMSKAEGILFTASRAFSLSGMKLSYIDNNDTLEIYGVNANGSLVSLGFAGIIQTGLAGAATVNFTAANNGTVVLGLLAPTGKFSRYLFTTRASGGVVYMGGTGQGYRIDSIDGVVPEPATWAMMITGFGFVGVAARRRRGAVAA